MPRATKKKDRKRADGRYSATFTKDGKTRYFYSTASQTDANRKRDLYKAEQIALGILGKSAEPRRVFFEKWALQWLETKEAKVKGSTFSSSYERPTKSYIIPAFGDRVITDIKPIELESLLLRQQKTVPSGLFFVISCIFSPYFPSPRHNTKNSRGKLGCFC